MTVLAANLLAIVVLLVFTVGSVWLAFHQRPDQDQRFRLWFYDWLSGLSHEFAGALITSIVVLILVTFPLQNLAWNEQLQDLLRQARSNDIATSQLAVRTMADFEWFSDGKLLGANLHGADLRELPGLGSVELERVDLSEANLENVHFVGVNLRNANLAAANLQRIYFLYADFEGADLWGVNLTEGVYLMLIFEMWIYEMR